MPTIERPVTGNFCWIEGNFSDVERAKRFYGDLFGWTCETVQYPAAGDYALVKKGLGQVGGFFALPEAAKAMGARPSWLNYVAVEDVAAATAKAERLGARVNKAPFDAGPGKMSIIADPTGAVLALWQSVTPTGIFVWRETNTMCWQELTTTDPSAATKFYVQLFGWKADVVPMGDFDYTLLYNGDEQIAGLMPQPKPMKEAGAPSFWTVYFDVANCDNTSAHAQKLGAAVVMAPTDIPNVGRFAVLKDLEGAGFAIMQSKASSG